MHLTFMDIYELSMLASFRLTGYRRMQKLNSFECAISFAVIISYSLSIAMYGTKLRWSQIWS